MSERIISSEPGPWADRFRDLPRFPIPPGVLCPQFDGDMAEPDQLAETVLDAVSAGGRVGVGPKFGEIHAAVVRDLGIDNSLFFPSINPWPIDHAAKLVDAWRAETSEKAAAA